MSKNVYLTLELKTMFRDALMSIMFIVGGNTLRIRMDSIIDSILATSLPVYNIFGLPLDFWLKITSGIAMWVGIIVGLITIHSFIKSRVEYYKQKRNK